MVDDANRHRRPVLPAVATLVLTLAMLIGGGTTAHAHGDEGEMEVLTAEPAGPLEIAIEVGVVYANDDDLATEATITVTAVGPDGATVGPIDVPRTTDAKYGTTFEVPAEGAWTLTVTSTDPAAEQTTEVTASGAAATTDPTAPTSDPTPSTPATDDPALSTSATDDPATTDPGDPGTAPASADPTDDEGADDDGNGLGLLVILAVLVAGLAAFGMIILRGRSSDPSSEPDDDGSRS